MLFATTRSCMMCPPGGPTTISLLLASLSKLLSARWWSPVQRMKHQWRYFSLGRCSSEAVCIPKGASLSCIWERCCVCLQSDSSLSGLELNSQKAVGVLVGFTCSKHTPGVCVYGYDQLKPEELEIWLFHPSLSKHRNEFQFPVRNDCSELGSTHHHQQQARVFVLLVELCLILLLTWHNPYQQRESSSAPLP